MGRSSAKNCFEVIQILSKEAPNRNLRVGCLVVCGHDEAKAHVTLLDWFIQNHCPRFTVESFSFACDSSIHAQAKLESRWRRVDSEGRDVTSTFRHLQSAAVANEKKSSPICEDMTVFSGYSGRRRTSCCAHRRRTKSRTNRT